MTKISGAKDFRISDPSQTVEIFRGGENATFDEPITIPELFNKRIESYGYRMAMMVKDTTTQTWSGITYKEYKDKVEKIAKVFIKLGLKRHGAVAILASNCAEWLISDLAAVFAG